MTPLEMPSEEREVAEAKRVVEGVRLPPEIVKVEVRAGVDSTGDPAMWITLWIDKEIKFDRDKSKALNQVAEDIQVRLMAAGLSRFPYTVVDQAA